VKNVPFPRLQSERIILRQLEIEDAEAVLFLRSDPGINQYIHRPVPQNLVDAQDFIKKINKNIDSGSTVYWSISRIGHPEMIGAVSLWHFSEDGTTAEIGYELDGKFQRQGIMSEAISLALTYGFQTLHFDKIVAHTHHANEASTRMLEKIGFLHQEGEKDLNNEFNVIYSLWKTEWEI